MNAFFVISLLIALIVSSKALPVFTEEDNRLINHSEIVDTVNSLKSSWKAAVPVKFANATIAQFKSLLGSVLPTDSEYVAPLFYKTEFSTADDVIPASFDVRTAWPACAAISGHVRDQSNCGSCWAVSSSETFNDRYCIKTGDAKTLFSMEDTVSCCTGLTCSFSMGCNGGQPSGAWNWFVKEGVSSGGDYEDVNKGTTCKPYSMASCAHHVEPPAGVVACDTLPEYKTPKCTSTCSDSAFPTSYKNDKHYASSSYGIRGIANIQKELMEKGSITVTMTVYEDFEAYSSGVYQHVTGKSLGGHAIKLVGWGSENGVDYWICNNSWNYYWGENGSFRILRGTNECGIESGASAGDV